MTHPTDDRFRPNPPRASAQGGDANQDLYESLYVDPYQHAYKYVDPYQHPYKDPYPPSFGEPYGTSRYQEVPQDLPQASGNEKLQIFFATLPWAAGVGLAALYPLSQGFSLANILLGLILGFGGLMVVALIGAILGTVFER